MSKVNYNNSCYLCSSPNLKERDGIVRDDPDLRVLECESCQLVMLDCFDHISDQFYEASGMHEGKPYSVENWLNDTAKDDQRRFDDFKEVIINKSVLDFGCGAGGFLKLITQIAEHATGIELEKRVIEHWGSKLDIKNGISKVDQQFDLIFSFHVFEHLIDPVKTLRQLSDLIVDGGKIYVEVPNADDALLTLYDSKAFQNFTYWSQHLFLFNTNSLNLLAKAAGMKCISVEHIQRYPLSNHLYWLSHGKPGGHNQWNFLNGKILNDAYANQLATLGKTDTVIAKFEK